MLPNWITGLFLTDRVEEFSNTIASRSQSAIWNRVAHQVASLGAAEARGYIRARAAAVIHQETNRLITEVGSRFESRRRRLTESATEKVIPWILTQAQLLRERRLQSAPAKRLAA